MLCQFVEDKCMQNAGALAYTTLLSLVPLMAIMISIFSAFPMFDNLQNSMSSFIFENFVPTSGSVVQSYLDQFAGRASRLTATGLVFLLITALMLMATIDRAFDMIWKCHKKRKLTTAFMVYWAALTLTPLLMGGSLAVSSYLMSLPILSDAANTVVERGKLWGLTPVFFSFVAFTILYRIVPQGSVRFKEAVAGGLLSALLFEIAKKGFAFYVTTFPGYEKIYGTLAAIPIFLVWVYLSWLVVLLGAELTYCLGRHQDAMIKKEQRKTMDFSITLHIIFKLWQAQKQGVNPTKRGLSNELKGIPLSQVETILSHLLLINIVHQTNDKKWSLSRDLSYYQLSELYDSLSFVIPKTNVIHDEIDEVIQDLILNIRTDQEKHMNISMAELFVSKK